MVQLVQYDPRPDALALNLGGGLNFDVISQLSDKQNSFLRNQEQAADFAFAFLDGKQQNVNDAPAAVAANQVQVGTPSNGTVLGA